jgi:hypothetical protein
MTLKNVHANSRPKTMPEVNFDEDRIDWERRSRHSKERTEAAADVGEDEVIEEDTSTLVRALSTDFTRNHGKRRKSKHLIMDESSGRMVVRRRRRPNRQFGDWHEEEYE